MTPLAVSGIVVGLIVLILAWIAALYNGLVRVRNACNESWADIDTELRRRYDLIPNLIESVKGYAAHEKDVFERADQAPTPRWPTRDLRPRKRTTKTR